MLTIKALLLLASVDDYVAVDDRVRFIDAFMNDLDLGGAGFARSRPPAGSDQILCWSLSKQGPQRDGCHPVKTQPPGRHPARFCHLRASQPIERCLGRLKHFRRFATRYDRRTIHFTGFVHTAAAINWLR